MKRQSCFGVDTISPMIEPDKIRPVGETPEEQEEHYELYRQGVMHAWEAGREEIREEQRESEMLLGNPELLPLLQAVRRERRRKLRLIKNE